MPDWLTLTSDGKAVSIDDRGYQYGDGLFESIAIRDAQPRLWPMHWQRLMRGCTVLDIAPPNEQVLRDGLAQVIAESQAPVDHAVAKIVISAGNGQRGYGRGRIVAPSINLALFPSNSPTIDCYRNGVDTVLCDTRLASGSPTAGLKTLNRLEQVLARSELQRGDAFEGLTMDAEDRVICGTMSNVFFVHSNSIATPPVNQCGVAGVMRRHIIESLHLQGVAVSMVELPAEKLIEVDELFIANSQFGILPVKQCDDIEFGIGDVSKQVMKTLADNGIAECRL